MRILDKKSVKSTEKEIDNKIYERLDIVMESFNNDDLFECDFVQDKNSLLKAFLNNIRGHYNDKEWACNVKPMIQYTDELLLLGYVAALFIYNVKCPQNEAEIESMGVFKKYAFAFLRGGGTLEDIIKKYDELSKKIFFQQLNTLTLQDFYNPKNNQIFFNINHDVFPLGEGGKIGLEIRIYDLEDKNNVQKVVIYENILAKSYEIFKILYQAADLYQANRNFQDPDEIKETKYFEVEIGEIAESINTIYCFKSLDEKETYHIEKEDYDIYSSCFDKAKSLDDVINNIKRLQEQGY